MWKPTVTIGISFRDPGTYFTLALQSVFAQTFTDWELVLCDDGSRDGSVDLARSLSDSRVRVLRDGLSKSLAVRLNQMVSVANGEYFFRMDADDVMHPERVRTQLSVLADEEGCVLGTAAYALDADSRITGLKRAQSISGHGFAARHAFYHSTVAARTQWFRRNPYSEAAPYYRSEDAELWCRTEGTTPFCWLEDALMYIREVGTFSMPKYIGTAGGVLQLAYHYGGTASGRLSLTLLQLGKFSLMSVLDYAGHADWIVRRRALALDPRAAHRAAEGLDRVRQTALPIEHPRYLTT